MNVCEQLHKRYLTNLDKQLHKLNLNNFHNLVQQTRLSHLLLLVFIRGNNRSFKVKCNFMCSSRDSK